MNKYKANFRKDHTSKWTWQNVSGYKNKHLGKDVVGFSKYQKTYGLGVGLIRDVQNDYRKFIPNKSDGLAVNGTELLNESIEAYIYSVLGAEAKTRQSIYDNRASALETQKVFRRNLEDSIIHYDTSVWINNMNKAVSDAVVLNLAVSPPLWSLPSSVVILKNPIDGHKKL